MRRSARYSRRPRAECTAHVRYRRRGKSAEICQIHACRRADGAKAGIILRFQCRGTDRSVQGWTGSYFLLFCCWDNILCLLSIVRYERKVKRGHTSRAGGSLERGGSFSAPADRGARTALACSPCPGGTFLAPTKQGTRTAAGGFAPRAEQVPPNLSGGIRRCGRRERRARPPRQKGRTTCGFPSSLNSYLSLG